MPPSEGYRYCLTMEIGSPEALPVPTKHRKPKQQLALPTTHTTNDNPRLTKMERTSFFLLLLGAVACLGYMPHSKDHYLTDLLLRDMVDRMGKDLAAAADSYLDLPENSRVIKDLENEEISDPIDFDRMSDSPSPSLRDQEYLQHSSLWGHQFVAGGAGEGKQRLKPDGSVQNQQQIKSDAALPAYCNPPNPCPVGYSAEDGCLEEFENTAAFSRDYQTSQDCMCDSEHMFECPVRGFDGQGDDLDNELHLDRIMEKLTVENQHKNLVAKKFHIKKDSNPFLRGEKLPVAAKKGNNLLVR
ncbi:hypothetical protein RUM43_009920 [Polyplax serrata]|uniref:Neuroendocrine protein 7B2 n=1 Tax=Polyplax serrata TaxID=468196 RepID=A0AAN8PJV7_POLSC